MERSTLRYEVARAFYSAASRSDLHRRHGRFRAIVPRLTSRLLLHVPVAVVQTFCAPIAWIVNEHVFRKLLKKSAVRLTSSIGGIAGLLGFIGNPYQKIVGF